jgi:hypothetical protein
MPADRTTSGLAHVATVSFLASRAAPSGAFALAAAGGVALARAAALRGLRQGYGASAGAMLQTVAIMGPARVNAPLTQAASAPLVGRLHARGHGPAVLFAAALAIRLVHYTLLSALAIWVVLGGLDAYAGSYDTLTGWIPFAPRGAAGALVVTAIANVFWALIYSALQVAIYRRALRAWPVDAPPAEHAAATGAESEPETRFDPRAIVMAAALASGVLLAGTAWPLLAGVAAWLALAWVATRADARTIPFGAALAGVLALTALTGALLAGLGLDVALRRALRAALLVAVATWMRAAARPSGLRTVFGRMLYRLRAVPGAREAAATLDGLDSGPRLLAAGRAVVTAVANVPKRPVPLVDAVIGWVAGEARGFRAAASAPRRAALTIRLRDAALIALATVPALALLGG